MNNTLLTDNQRVRKSYLSHVSSKTGLPQITPLCDVLPGEPYARLKVVVTFPSNHTNHHAVLTTNTTKEVAHHHKENIDDVRKMCVIVVRRLLMTSLLGVISWYAMSQVSLQKRWLLA